MEPWVIVLAYEDRSICGGFGQRFDILMIWPIDRLGRSVLHVANALAELDAAGAAR
jgi:hypothetical protein